MLKWVKFPELAVVFRFMLSVINDIYKIGKYQLLEAFYIADVSFFISFLFYFGYPGSFIKVCNNYLVGKKLPTITLLPRARQFEMENLEPLAAQ